MKVIYTTTARNRIQKYIRQAILARAVQVCSGGLFEPSNSQDRATKIARLVAEDLLVEYRMTRRK